MADASESSTERTALAGERRVVNELLAWTGVVAAAVFIVAVVFFSGFFIGRSTDGFGGDRGYHHGPLPGMMGPGMMGPYGQWSPGQTGSYGPWGPGQPQPPTTSPTTPRP